MKLLAEITMYPLHDEYIAPVDRFLERLNAGTNVEVKTNRMSTQLYGDYSDVMLLLTDAMQDSTLKDGKAAFVVKYLPGADRTIGIYE